MVKYIGGGEREIIYARAAWGNVIAPERQVSLWTGILFGNI